MLGLGISKSAQGVKSGIVKLLNSLKRRAEYFENKKDSKSEIKVLKDYELLDKATILLTPTATSDARVHSVKTYTGDELVTNGDFSDGINDWTSNASATLSTENDKLKVSVSGAGSGYSQQNIIGLTIGATYKISAEGEIGTSTRLALYTPNAGFNNLYSDGAISTFFTATSTTENLRLYVYDDGAYGFWDNISVVDVSSDFDFDRASSATRINSSGLVQDMQSITDPELVLNGDFEELGSEVYDNDITAAINGGTWVDNGDGTFTVTGDGSPSTGVGVRDAVANYLTNGKTYKWTVEGDNVTLALYDASYALVTSGTSPLYFTATATNRLYISPSDGVSATYSNVSVKQVNVDSEGNDIWSLNATGDSTSIITDKLTLTCDDGDFTSAAQSYSFVDGNTYKLSFDLTGDNQSKSFTFRDNSSALGGLTEDISLDFEGTETKTFIFTANTNSDAIYIKRNSAGTYSWSIDNVSLKDITFSTDVDLARINYDGNGENGHILLEPTSTNLVPYSEDFSVSAGWQIDSSVTLSLNTSIAPDGVLSADNINYVGSLGSPNGKQLQRSFTIAGGTANKDFTNSIYVKGVGKFRIKNTHGGVVDNFTNDITATNDWVRYDFPVSNSSSAGNGTQVIAILAATTDDAFNLDIWGAQLEELSYATSYIPTLTGSTVTRAAETLTGSGNSTLINTTEGTIYLESKLLNTTGTKLFSLGAGTNNADPAVLIGYAGSNMYFDFIDGDSLVDSPDIRTISGINTDSYNKMAISYTSTSVTVFLNGVKKVTKSGVDFTPSNNLKALYAGYGVGSKFEGEIKKVTVFNEALTDDELELLTGVTNYGSFSELASANGYTII